ncbi:MAG: hypothetical protein V3R82_01100 [Candidatus Hydrothermarchaeales archaeon]
MPIYFEAVNLLFIFVVVALGWYYWVNRLRMEEMSRRLILVGIMFSVHELSFLLHDKVVYQLTEIMLMIALFYALIFVTDVNKKVTETTQKLEEAEIDHAELMKRLELIKDKTGE